MPLHVVLYQPEIPQNTGNIARTCAATGAVLHLVHPLGFYLTDRHLKRAGVDYWDRVQVAEHASWQAFRDARPGARLWYTSTRAARAHSGVAYRDGDCLVFGPESRGLPAEVLAAAPDGAIRIPMVPGARSLNVANAAAIVLYEALRQVRPGWY